MAFLGDSIYWVEVEKIVPNPFQPRREFDQHKLQELADSIRMYGVLQPLTVTRKEIQREDGTFYSEYELIAGERRLRASKLAGVSQVPVIIRDGEQSEQEKLELAIIENLQREDLNAVDRAIAFKQLSEQFGLSHAQVAQKVGRSREYVSNSIRLLGLPEHMLDSLKRGEMMEGHARTLLMLTDRPEEQDVVYREILLKKLSVREVERIVRKIATDKVRKKNPGEFDANLIEFEKKFTETLGTRVQIQKTDFGGKLTIDYFSEDDLAAILRRIKDEAAEQTAAERDTLQRLAASTPLAVVAPEISPLPREQTAPAPAVVTPAEAPSAPVQNRSVDQHMAVSPITPPPEQVETPSTPEVTPAERSVLAIAPSHPETAQPLTEFAGPPAIPQPNETESPMLVPPSAVTSTTPTSPVSEEAPSPEPLPAVEHIPKAPAPEPDESDLYSIKNFGV